MNNHKSNECDESLYALIFKHTIVLVSSLVALTLSVDIGNFQILLSVFHPTAHNTNPTNQIRILYVRIFVYISVFNSFPTQKVFFFRVQRNKKQ